MKLVVCTFKFFLGVIKIKYSLNFQIYIGFCVPFYEVVYKEKPQRI